VHVYQSCTLSSLVPGFWGVAEEFYGEFEVLVGGVEVVYHHCFALFSIIKLASDADILASLAISAMVLVLTRKYWSRTKSTNSFLVWNRPVFSFGISLPGVGLRLFHCA